MDDKTINIIGIMIFFMILFLIPFFEHSAENPKPPKRR